MDLSQFLAQIFAAAGVLPAQVPAEMDLSLGNLLRSLVILVVVYFLARFVRGLLKRGFRQTKFDTRVEQLITHIVYYGIIALGIVWILGGFGLSVVILGVALGFAFKDLLQNFAAGLLIMGTRPFASGDWIAVGTSEGRVAQISWRGTWLDTFDGRRVIIPNSSIITNVVTNNSYHSQLRSTLHLALDVHGDFARVERLILDALSPIQGISQNPPPTVLLESLDAARMNLAVHIWVHDPVSQQKRIVSQCLRAIKDALPTQLFDPPNAPTVDANPPSPK